MWPAASVNSRYRSRLWRRRLQPAALLTAIKVLPCW
jgi:hypothetical protein